MRTERLRGWVMAGSLLATACSGGGGGGAPSPTGSVTVTVVGADAIPVQGVTVLSSYGSTVYGSATTDLTGGASVPVAPGSTVTALSHFGSVYVATTLAGVGPGTATVPLYQVQSVQPVSVTLTSSTSMTGNTGGVVYAGWSSFCGRNVAFGGTVTVDVEPYCLETDGSITLTGLVLGGASGVMGYAALPDLPITTTTATIAVHTTSAGGVALIPFAYQNLPADPTGTIDVRLAFARKGQPFGFYNGTSTIVGSTNDIIGVSRMPRDLLALADSLQSYADLKDTDGSFREEYREALSTSSMTLDLGAMLGLPATGTKLSFDAGSPVVTLVDQAGAQGTASYAFLSWTEAGATHQWWLYGPPPAGNGTRSFQAPPLPAASGGFSYGLGTSTVQGAIGYYHADYVTSFLQAANPYYLPPRGGAWARGYAFRPITYP